MTRCVGTARIVTPSTDTQPAQIKAIESGAANSTPDAPENRIFELHKSIYQMRVTRIQNAAQAKRNAEKLKNPTSFPAVPMGDPSRTA